jgi:hypothetical protein
VSHACISVKRVARFSLARLRGAHASACCSCERRGAAAVRQAPAPAPACSTTEQPHHSSLSHSALSLCALMRRCLLTCRRQALSPLPRTGHRRRCRHTGKLVHVSPHGGGSYLPHTHTGQVLCAQSQDDTYNIRTCRRVCAVPYEGCCNGSMVTHSRSDRC